MKLKHVGAVAAVLGVGLAGLVGGHAIAENGRNSSVVPAPNAATPGGGSFAELGGPADLSSGQKFVPVTPCRTIDTRQANAGFPGAFGAPSLPAGGVRTATLTGRCGVPSTAKAVSANVTVTNTLGAGFVTVYPAGSALPIVSTLNFTAGQTVANAALIPLSGAGGASFFASGATDLIVDVNGYYEDAVNARAYATVSGFTPTFVSSYRFSGVTRPSTGVFCLTPAAGVDIANSSPVVTVDWSYSAGSDLLAYAALSGACPSSTLEVRTYDFGADTANPVLTLTDDVSFRVMVP